MTSALVPLAFEGRQVRVVDRDGDPWFVAGDAAKILGHRDAADLTRLLDPDEKGTHNLRTPGGEQEVSIISEAGLYRAIVGRRAGDNVHPELAAAIGRFQRWVFHDVLPSIRRTGSYTAPTTAPTPAIPGPKDVAVAFRSFASIGKLIGLDRNQAALAANQATLKVTGVDALALMGSTHLIAPQQERLLTPTQIGVEAGLGSARVANATLANLGYQTAEPAGWEPTAKGRPFAVFQDTGKRQGDGTPVRQLKWTAAILRELRGRGDAEAA